MPVSIREFLKGDVSMANSEKEQKLLEEYGEFVAFDATIPSAVRIFKQDFETEEEWLKFKQKVLQSDKDALEIFIDNLQDIEVDDLIGYPPKVSVKVRVVENVAEEHR